MEEKESINFIHRIIEKDLAENKFKGEPIITRFPPEPNGYLHIGHAKSIFLNFGTAEKYKGFCNLRFDDTNPAKENIEYVESIKKDVDWLGFENRYKIFYASDYFEKLYNFAILLIKQGNAFVCHLTEDEIREKRGTLTEKGIESPYRNRSVEENLELFNKMKNGEFEEGKAVLRAKIDMKSPNISLRDPVIYRIKKVHHHKTANKWCIYPLYDFAHCLSDSIEKITHSLCSLEFENNRPLYDWFLETLQVYHSQQIEFARLNLTYTILSKRKLIQLIELKAVSSWDDPRMPTISGLRRRGVSKEALKSFCEKIGIARADSTVDIELFEHCIREDLNKKSKRAMAVLEPLKVIIENYPNDTEYLEAKNHPEDLSFGTRKISFSKTIYIEKTDFMENPDKNFFRLSVGREVRLRYAYFIFCKEIKKNENGEIIEIICTYDPQTRGGKNPPDGRKVKSTIHWVNATDCINAEIRLYDKLLKDKIPAENIIESINPNSLKIIQNAKLESSLINAKDLETFQFERLGYFCLDKNSKPNSLVFNKTIGLVETEKKKVKS